MPRIDRDNDPRTLEIGTSAFFCHYRINGTDMVARIWFASYFDLYGNVRSGWQFKERTEVGDYGKTYPLSPEYLNYRRSRS